MKGNILKTKQTTLQFASRKTYDEFKKTAKREKLTLRLAITDAMKLWIATKKDKAKKCIPNGVQKEEIK